MKASVPYLFFDSNCSEAMDFYKICFGGKLEIMRFKDAPPESCPEGVAKDLVMHASLQSDAFQLMASDNPYGKVVVGDNIHISVECESMDQLESVFKQMGTGGKIVMPLEDAFWGSRYGMVTDKYGINWMLSFPLK